MRPGQHVTKRIDNIFDNPRFIFDCSPVFMCHNEWLTLVVNVINSFAGYFKLYQVTYRELFIQPISYDYILGNIREESEISFSNSRQRNSVVAFDLCCLYHVRTDQQIKNFFEVLKLKYWLQSIHSALWKRKIVSLPCICVVPYSSGYYD